MTTLKEKLTEDLKTAMRSGELLRRDTLRMLLAAVKQVEIDQRTSLNDPQTVAVLQKEAKKRQESIADFCQAGRSDDAEGERCELAIIEEYLPQQATETELTRRAEAIVAELGLQGPAKMGMVMKQMMAEFQGRADGRLVNQIVRDLLKT